jgi:hypothetical protein
MSSPTRRDEGGGKILNADLLPTRGSKEMSAVVQKRRNTDPNELSRFETRPRRSGDADADAAAIAEQVWNGRAKGSTKPIPIPHFPPPAARPPRS